MHILIAAVSSARQPSGICRHAANLAIGLGKTPDVERVTLLVGRWQLAYFRNALGLSDTKTSIVPVDATNNPYSRNTWYFFALPRIARRLRADVVHLSFPAPVRRAAFCCSVVSSLHDLYPYDAPRNFGRLRVLFNRLFLRQCLTGSDAVVCSSNFTQDRLRMHAPARATGKATRIYQCVTLDANDERPPALPNIAPQPFLLTVAQHRSNKNLDYLLLAFAELRRNQPANRLSLVVLGAEGPETEKLHSLVRQQALQDDVVFCSGLPDAELCWLYRHCELMIVCSGVEGFCFPLVEALRCGSRVLCSDIPVLREIGEGACSYFPLHQSQPADLARAIDTALRQPSPRPQLSERFSLDSVSLQYLDLYRELLRRTGKPVRTTSQAIADSIQYDRYAS
jgi:glycosyltransferase involved in cell wall biosynthesis